MTTNKAPSKKKNKKKVTLNEFKAWLEGVEELQADDWSPDKNQWALIRNKLRNIVEEVKEVEVQAPIYHAAAAQPVTQQQSSFPQPPSAFQPGPLPSSLNTAPIAAEISPQAKAALAGTFKAPSTMAMTSNDRSSTPNIDSSNGSFDSSFE